ncbi:MAG: DUF5683 domain-containing protein [Bacteroidota bacterium]|nr:DUF5683 domain-containing protein [Bacteroidota bacterium]
MLTGFTAWGQEDSVSSPPTVIIPRDSAETQLDPGRVALHSALIPGWGQLNNGKYDAWQYVKIPVIWGAGFATVSTARWNHKDYIRYRDAYRIRTDGDSLTIDEYDPILAPQQGYAENSLLIQRERSRRGRDLFIILTAGVYVLNIIDAYVLAHLNDFDISDDLTLRIHPPLLSNIAGRPVYTMGFSLNFR